MILGARGPRSRLHLYVAIAAWVLAFAVIIALVLTGHKATRSYQVYEGAGRHWLHGQPLYETHDVEGFQYFPQAAIVMAAFAWLGQPLGGVLWRTLWWTMYAVGVWRVTRRLAPERAERGFLLASALAIWPGTGALGNGQANLAVAGLLLHATVELVDRRWWRATAVLAFGVALKPLMAVPLLLAGALHRPMRGRLVLALVIVAGVPWLAQHHAYVSAQYTTCLAKLRLAEQPPGLYEDLRGLIATVGWRLPHPIYVVVRAVAALATLGLCWRAKDRLRPAHAGVVIAACAATYLMLFNPRTQSTSYAIATGPAAALAALHLLERRWSAAAPLLAVILAWMISYHDVGFVEFWLKPLGSVVLASALIVTVQRPPAPWRAPSPSPAAGPRELETP